MKVITRIAPSPTGRLHIGTARTALFNYLFARHEGGRFIFRSEDTDRARSLPEYEKEIMDGLAWLGLSWDEFYRQSERQSRHREVLEQLVGEGKAYVSKEPAKENPANMVEVVRLKNPGGNVVFDDLIRGGITTPVDDLKDFVIARAIDDPLYHFAVVVDDFDSGVTHVIRGEDHISNTARQVLIQEAIGAPRPLYAHLPLIVDEKRAKLSKRSGATSVMDYKEEGYLPEGLVNYLALLGWNPGDDREDFSLAELVEVFSLAGVQKSGAAWNREKLLSVNQRSMRKLSDEAFIARAGFDESVAKAVPLLKERAHTFGEAKHLVATELACLFNAPALDAKHLTEKGGDTGGYLRSVAQIIETLADPITAAAAKEALMPYADETGRGVVLWPLRYALSGAEKSPDPFTLIAILGSGESLSRIRAALAILSE